MGPAGVDAPVLLVFILLRVEHARHPLHVVQAVDVRRRQRLGPHDEVGEDAVVVCLFFCFLHVCVCA